MRGDSSPIGLAWPLAGWLAGTALHLQQAALGTPALHLGLALPGLCWLLAAGLRWPRPGWPAAPRLVGCAHWLARGCALGCMGCLAFALTGFRAGAFLDQALDPSLEGRTLELTGRIAAMPQPFDNGLRLRLAVESARLDGRTVAVPPLVLLGWYGGWQSGPDGLPDPQRLPPEVRAGERWRLAARLKAPHGGANPHGFDYELWLWEQGLQATGTVRAGPRDPPAQRLEATWRHPVERLRQAVRDRIFAQVPDRQAAGVLAALLVGDQAAIDRSDWDVFRATGVAHLMAISGLHVTMFAWAAAALVGALWRRIGWLCLVWPAPHAALAGGLLLAFAYAVFSGWGVPSQRTVLMLALVGALRMAGRRWPWPLQWLLACTAVAAADPWAMTQAGFWLSFVAVGVLFAGGKGAWTAPVDAPAGARRLLMSVRALLREQWVVSLALAPLSLLLFGQLSLVGLVANLFAIPWVTLCVTPLAIAGVLLPWAWNAGAVAVQALGVALQWLAAVPGATWSGATPALWAAAAGIAGGVLLVARLPWGLRALGVPLLLPALFWQVPRPAAGELDLVAVDVGQGNAVVVRTATHTLVYDSGPRYSRETDAGHRVLVPLLRALGERVDRLVLSHRDSDHTGGAAAVLAAQPASDVLSSIEDDHALRRLRPVTRCVAGQRWDWDGVRFEILHPLTADYAQAVRPNALSCVLRIDTRGASVLLAGDIEQAQEARIVKSATTPGTGRSLHADLLLVPHHGSKTSSSESFLRAVSPTLAVVQAGYRNRFGHPAPAVMERYHGLGVALVDTARCGAVHWHSGRPGAVECERERAARYWMHRPPESGNSR